MKTYSHFGFSEFLIALGYKADMIKRYFVEYANLNGDISACFSKDKTKITHHDHDAWTVHLKDTGYHSNTGGRLKLLSDCLKGERFMLTYGDGVSNVNIADLLAFHKSHGKMVTLTAVRPPARFGGLVINDQSQITQFAEKAQMSEGWISGGFMVCEPGAVDLIPDIQTSFEHHVLEMLSTQGELMAYQHNGFWQCMDTTRDMNYLENLWTSGNAPWKVW
jgi:glucose-1-phosphate cytidylyltransferase